MATSPIHLSTGFVLPVGKVDESSTPKPPRRLRSVLVALASLNRALRTPIAHTSSSQAPGMHKLVSTAQMALYKRRRKQQELKTCLNRLDRVVFTGTPTKQAMETLLATVAHLMIGLGMRGLPIRPPAGGRQRSSVSSITNLGGLSPEQMEFLHALYPAEADSLDDSPHARGIPDAIAPHQPDSLHIAVSDAP